MESCPPEVWMHIFSFACIDNGHTGRSLSLVSRAFYENSLPIRMQSVVIRHALHIFELASTVSRTPPNLCQIRYLFIDLGSATAADVPSDDDDSDYVVSSSTFSTSSSSDSASCTSESESMTLQDEIIAQMDGDAGDLADHEHLPLENPIENLTIDSHFQPSEKEQLTNAHLPKEQRSDEEQDILDDIAFLETTEGRFRDGIPASSFPEVPYMTVDEELAALERQVYEAIQSIIRVAAPFLKRLQIRLIYNEPAHFFFLPNGVQFPSLSQLSISTQSFEDPRPESEGMPICPVLKRLELLGGMNDVSRHFAYLARIAPALVTVQIPFDRSLIDEGRVQLEGVVPTWHQPGSNELELLPKSVEKVDMFFWSSNPAWNPVSLLWPRPVLDERVICYLERGTEMSEQISNWLSESHVDVWSSQ